MKKDPCLAIVILGSFLFSLTFSIISCLRYEAFSLVDYDSAVFIHENWKILHGSTRLTILDGASLWGHFVDVITFLTAPVFWMSGYDPKILFILQALATGFGAVPVFLIARGKISHKLALALTLSYLLNPSLWFINLNEYNALSIVTFTLLMTFYFFQVGRFGWFSVFLILSILNRLDIGVVTAMFGVYALVAKRPWKWVLVPIVASAAWVGFGLFVLIPKFRNLFGYYDIYYPQFGQGFTNIVINMITQPKILWDSLVNEPNAKFLYQVLSPVAFLSLIGIKEFLICILALMQHLLSVRLTEHTIEYHYTSAITPFVYISAVYGIAKISKIPFIRQCVLIALIVFSVSSNIIHGPVFHHDERVRIRADEADAYKKQILKHVGPDASVASSFEFAARLAGRYNYYSFHYIFGGLYHSGAPYPVPQNIDAALINFADMKLQSFRQKGSDLKIRQFLEMNHLGVTAMFNSTVLFQKGGGGLSRLYEVRQGVDNRAVITINQEIGLRSFEADGIEEGEFRFLDLTFHWIPLAEASHQMWMHPVIVDAQYNQVYYDARPLCYDIYPAPQWKQGEEILDHYRMLLPPLPPGRYKLAVLFFAPDSGSTKLLPIRNANSDVVKQDRIIMAFDVLEGNHLKVPAR